MWREERVDFGGRVAARDEFDVLVGVALADKPHPPAPIEKTAVQAGIGAAILRTGREHSEDDAVVLAGDPDAVSGGNLLARQVANFRRC